MDKEAKVYVAGHTGLVGSAIVKQLRCRGFDNVILRTHQELDLTSQPAVADFFEKAHPDYVFLAAAKVGGILANSTYPADFILQNLLIQTNVIQEAYRKKVKRLLFLGSSCIYPRAAPQPIKEESLLTGPLEITNRPYAVAKISGIEMCWAFNRQYGTSFLAAMPTNLYGPGDNYHPEQSHLVPGLLRRMHEAKRESKREVVIWGTGFPKREFMYSEDAADACIFLMTLSDAQFRSLSSFPDQLPIVNVGSGSEISVATAAEVIAEAVGYKGKLIFDTSKPDGTPRKLLDCSRLTALGWKARTEFRQGLECTYSDFAGRFENVSRLGA